MNTITTIAPKQRKPRAKPARSIRILEQPSPDTDGWAAIEITVGKQTDRYLLHTIPSDFGHGAIGFEVEKLDTDLRTTEVYNLHLSDRPADRTCDCLGCLRHGHCKHVEGLAALRKAGFSLPVYRSGGDFAANDPIGHAAHVAALTTDDYPGDVPSLDHYCHDDDGPDAAA